MGMKEQLEGLSDLTINFGEGGMMIVNFILAFVMFGVALGIKTSTFFSFLIFLTAVIILNNVITLVSTSLKFG